MAIKILVAVAWLVSAVVGLAPIAGWSHIDFYSETERECYYMPYQIDTGFSIFYACFLLAAFLLSGGCLLDAILNLRDLTRTGVPFTITPPLTKEYFPSLQKNGRGHYNVTSGFHSAYDSCRLVCILFCMGYLLNHLPYMVHLINYL